MMNLAVVVDLIKPVDVTFQNRRIIIFPSDLEIMPLDTRSFAFVSFGHQFHSKLTWPLADSQT